VIADRYHARYLRTPTEVRRALVYVLQNGVKHARDEGRVARGQRTWIDPHSSAAFFTGWHPRSKGKIPTRDVPAHPLHGWGPPVVPVATARTWLLTMGWQSAGRPIDISEVPSLEAADVRRRRSRATSETTDTGRPMPPCGRSRNQAARTSIQGPDRH